MEILKSARIFADLSDDALARLADACTRRTYRRGQYLWYRGDDDARLAVVAEGLLKVVISSEEGDEVVLRTLGPGECLGELALLDGAPRSASAVAAESTTVLLLSRATLLDQLRRHPAVLDALLRSVGGRARQLTEQTGDLVFLDLAGRMAKLLLRLADPHGDGCDRAVVDLGLSPSDLAAIGASPAAANRVLQAMAARGLIVVDGPAIVLRDLPGLRRRAGI